MIIRSQSKGTIVNLEQALYINIVVDGDYHEICFKSSGYEIRLGKYSTEERALKALNYIQYACRSGNNDFEMPQDVDGELDEPEEDWGI